MSDLLDCDGLNFHVAKLYKKKIIDDYNLRFTDFRETGGDDTVFNFDFLLHAHSVQVVPHNIYNYISYPSSTSNRFDDNKWNRGKRLDGIITEYCKDMNILDNRMQLALDKRICKLAFWVSSEIAGLKQSISDLYDKINTISRDMRFRDAYQRAHEAFCDNIQIRRLYNGQILFFIASIKIQRYNIKSRIYRLFPSWLVKFYRKYIKILFYRYRDNI